MHLSLAGSALVCMACIALWWWEYVITQGKVQYMTLGAGVLALHRRGPVQKKF
jgi:hypothetical protein